MHATVAMRVESYDADWGYWSQDRYEPSRAGDIGSGIWVSSTGEKGQLTFGGVGMCLCFSFFLLTGSGRAMDANGCVDRNRRVTTQRPPERELSETKWLSRYGIFADRGPKFDQTALTFALPYCLCGVV